MTGHGTGTGHTAPGPASSPTPTGAPTTGARTLSDEISPEIVHDTVLGVAYPARAVIWVDSYCFEASSRADWRAVLARAGTAGGIIAIPDDGPPGDAWCEADLRLARMVSCACGRPLDPDERDSFNLALCAPCHEQAGWENTHSDDGHDTTPDPACPLCAGIDGGTRTAGR